MRPYEGMFLVDEGVATDNPQSVLDHIRGLLTRYGAVVARLEKWDTRRLAYEVDGKKRGAYFLAKFEADPAKISEISRDCQLSNLIMRAMLLKEENVGIGLEEAAAAARAAYRSSLDEAGQQPSPEQSPDLAPGAEPDFEADIPSDLDIPENTDTAEPNGMA